MSFSSDVKKELCFVNLNDIEQKKAQLYGMLIFGKTFKKDKIVFSSENPRVSACVSSLLEELYMPIIEKETALRPRNAEHKLSRITLINADDCQRIADDFGHIGEDITLRVNRANIHNDELVADFLRGAFIGCGSISDPMKSYHIEFCVPHKNLSLDLCKIMKEINECSFTPKTVMRSGSYVVYLKESEQICDLLTYIGATNSAMEIMGTKAVKLVRNNINRRINGEVANIGKIASASAKQLEAIEKIKRNGGLEALPEDLREIAKLRLENPEMSLRDLGQNLTVKISRSGANHRMQKILEIAQSQEALTNG